MSPPSLEPGSRGSTASAGRLVRLPGGNTHLIGTAPVTIGREPSSDIPVHSEDVSRRHAYVLRTLQGFLLIDSSLHGTYVNGERVQAQRILADGDLLEIGGQSFRFEQRSLEAMAVGGPASPGATPETTDHWVSPLPTARATGKLGLVAMLGERPAWRARAGIWIKRYGLSELVGIGMAFCCTWLTSTATDSPIAAGYSAAVGEFLGFYGSLVSREMLQEAYVAGARGAPFGFREIARTWRNLALEFGPSELLDVGLVRPFAMGIGIHVWGPGFGIVAGKITADLLFYIPVIFIYERRKRSQSAN
jgi:FHA domain-containing protein